MGDLSNDLRREAEDAHAMGMQKLSARLSRAADSATEIESDLAALVSEKGPAATARVRASHGEGEQVMLDAIKQAADEAARRVAEERGVVVCDRGCTIGVHSAACSQCEERAYVYRRELESAVTTLTAERDEWKARAEAAEADTRRMDWLTDEDRPVGLIYLAHAWEGPTWPLVKFCTDRGEIDAAMNAAEADAERAAGGRDDG